MIGEGRVRPGDLSSNRRQKRLNGYTLLRENGSIQLHHRILVPIRYIIRKIENARWILSPLSFSTSLYSVHRTKHDSRFLERGKERLPPFHILPQ